MRTRFATSFCLLFAATLALIGCAGSPAANSGAPASFLYNLVDPVNFNAVSANSYPAGSTGNAVAATSSTPIGPAGFGTDVCGDGMGNIYTLSTALVIPGRQMTVNVYSTASGVLTLKRSFNYNSASITFGSIVADSTGAVYLSSSFAQALFKFPANATGTVTPTIVSTGPFLFPMTTDSAGNIYGYAGSGAVYVYSAGVATPTPSKILNLTAIGATAIASVADIAVDSSGNIYLTGLSATTNTPFISEYSSATGTTTPMKTISGISTLLTNPAALAVDGAGNIYEEDASTTALTLHTNTIYTFSAAATGNIAPTSHFTPSTLTADSLGLVAY